MHEQYQTPEVTVETLNLTDAIASSIPAPPIERENAFVDFFDLF